MNTYKSDFRSAYNLLEKYKDDPYEDPVKTEEMLAELAESNSRAEHLLKIAVSEILDDIYYKKHALQG